MIAIDPSTARTFEWHLLRALRFQPATRLVPILVVTADWEELWGGLATVVLERLDTLRKPVAAHQIVAWAQGKTGHRGNLAIR